jgi:hypothetical protein
VINKIASILILTLLASTVAGVFSPLLLLVVSSLPVILFWAQDALGEPISEIESSEKDLTIQHLKSDYVTDLLSLEQFEEAVARVLRGEGYRQVTDDMTRVINKWRMTDEMVKPTISSSYGHCSLCATEHYSFSSSTGVSVV